MAVPTLFITGKQMIGRLALLVLFGFAADAAWAHAGLTSAGVDPNANNPQPEEPTLAQVAPVNGANAAAANGVNNAAAGVNPGAAGVPGTVAGVTGNGTAAPPAVSSRAVPPPPPPDPSTLPVSVIRPLNKPSGAVDEAGAVSNVHPAKPGPERQHAASAAAQKPPIANPTPPPPRPTPLPSTPRADSTTRALADKPQREPDEVADTASSSFIFYSGTGIAGTILLLSAGAFVRARRLDVTRT